MTTTLTPDRFEAARAFVLDHGRPLDAALLRLALGEGPAAEVLATLARFQNPDGGFGQGLEPDIPSLASSALATSLGLRLLVRAGAAGDHPMVVAAIAWLAGALDRPRGVWPIIGPDVEAAPHAPWWTWSDDLAARWNGFGFNPTAEILAHLCHYRAATPDEVLDAAEAGVRRTLAETPLIEGAYDLKCAVWLAASEGAPADIRAGLSDLVRRSIAAHDPNDDHAPVFELAASPRSPFAADVAERAAPALDALIAAQDEDGGWAPFWDWSFVDAAAWASARRDWRGWLTREAIETLRAWGRVAGG
jgi:hypothetical protein